MFEKFHCELAETDILDFSRGQRDNNNATVETEVNIAPFAQTDRRKRTKGDRRVQELQTTISQTFQTHLFTHLYPRSTISIVLHILSLDGGLLAACLNAASLALVDAGVPMPSILAAVTSGHISSTDDPMSSSDPVLDLSNAEEQELPFLSVATVAAIVGDDEKVAVLVMESKIQAEQGGGKLEGMLALGVDGCKRVRKIFEGIIKAHDAKVLQGRK